MTDEEILDNTVLQFTPIDFATISQALDFGMNEAKSRRIFRGFMRAVKPTDTPTDIAWALAQTLSNMCLAASTPEKGTEMLRHFIAMALLVQVRVRESGFHETKH